MNIVFLQLGSNIENRVLFLKNANKIIKQKVGAILDQSKIYESTPWGVSNQKNYLNQIIKVSTKLSANMLLHTIMDIEKKLGRVRAEKWGARSIDIDIIFYNDSIINTSKLSIPHKFMHERMFVLLPLNKIAPNMKHPIYNKTIQELISECKDSELVKEYAI